MKNLSLQHFFPKNTSISIRIRGTHVIIELDRIDTSLSPSLTVHSHHFNTVEPFWNAIKHNNLLCGSYFNNAILILIFSFRGVLVFTENVLMYDGTSLGRFTESTWSTWLSGCMPLRCQYWNCVNCCVLHADRSAHCCAVLCDIICVQPHTLVTRRESYRSHCHHVVCTMREG